MKNVWCFSVSVKCKYNINVCYKEVYTLDICIKQLQIKEH